MSELSREQLLFQAKVGSFRSRTANACTIAMYLISGVMIVYSLWAKELSLLALGSFLFFVQESGRLNRRLDAIVELIKHD